MLAEGTQGHLTGVALDHFGLRGDEPQVWELGVKEVWKVAKPLRRVDPHDGLAAAHRQRSTASSAARSSTRWATTCSRSGWSSGSTTATSSSRAHDLLQELKTHPKIRKMLEGGERLEWGAKTIPSGGFHSLPQRLHAPGLLLCGDGVGMVNIAAAQGRPLRDRVGPARRRGRVRARCSRGATPATALSLVRRRGARQLHLERPRRGARHAPGVRARLLRRRRARERDDGLEGPRQRRQDARRARRRPAAAAHRPRVAATRRRTASSRSTSSRRCSPRATRRATTSRTTSASSGACRATSRSCGCTCARRRCTRSAREGDDGTVDGRARAVELRAVRRDHRQGRPPHAARGRLRPRVHEDLIYRAFT